RVEAEDGAAARVFNPDLRIKIDVQNGDVEGAVGPEDQASGVELAAEAGGGGDLGREGRGAGGLVVVVLVDPAVGEVVGGGQVGDVQGVVGPQDDAAGVEGGVRVVGGDDLVGERVAGAVEPQDVAVEGQADVLVGEEEVAAVVDEDAAGPGQGVAGRGLEGAQQGAGAGVVLLDRVVGLVADVQGVGGIQHGERAG